MDQRARPLAAGQAFARGPTERQTKL